MRNLLAMGKAKWLKDKTGNLSKPPSFSDPKWCHWREELKNTSQAASKEVTPQWFEIITCNEKCWSKEGLFSQMIPEENYSVSTTGHALMDKYWNPAVLPTPNLPLDSLWQESFFLYLGVGRPSLYRKLVKYKVITLCIGVEKIHPLNLNIPHLLSRFDTAPLFEQAISVRIVGALSTEQDPQH